MTDPRQTPAWKQTRMEDKTLLLLGAILDALLPVAHWIATDKPTSWPTTKDFVKPKEAAHEPRSTRKTKAE